MCVMPYTITVCCILLSYTTKYCQVALYSDDVSQGFIIGQ